MKVCDKTCIFPFFPIINEYLCMAKRSLLSEQTSYIQKLHSDYHEDRCRIYGLTTQTWFSAGNITFMFTICCLKLQSDKCGSYI